MSSSVYLCVFVRVCVPLSLSLRASYSGERVSVEGPSGLGKTRLLRAIAELDRPRFQSDSLDHDGLEGNATPGRPPFLLGIPIASRLLYSSREVPFY